MKHKIPVLSLLFLLACSAFAQQNTLTQTSLSAAINNNVQSFYVASATNVTADPATVLYVDGEAMLVLKVSSTLVTVARAQHGTAAQAHASGAMVLSGRPDHFYTVNPSGSCTSTTVYVKPWININTGNQWLCSSITSTWVPGFQNQIKPAVVTTAVASTAGLVTPTGPLFHITGTSAITGFNIPVGYTGGSICAIPDAIFTTTAANNIALASTAVVNKTLCWTYDATNSKFVPSY